VHPGVELDEVLNNTGWKLRIAEDVGQTSEPSAAELKAIRDYDKDGFWTK
jgi:glutaconate CoA-transferase subunit B